MTPARKTFELLTSSSVCKIYTLLHSRGLVSFPLTQDAEAKADAIVANINNSYFGVEAYPSPEEKAVAYLYFLINDHLFTDGNKRTATLCFLTLCDINELKPRFEGFTLDQVAVTLEQAQGDHQEIIKATVKLLFPEGL
ncbi:TPA: hypothetical protein DIV48_03530 [Candidatus Kaiserbacteria bacterium]|nr:MAG: Fic/DOC family protein [Parcubacteria group bacterium GW2011_GWA1_56_13]KKW46233.1 MAG: Fic/DOC family protein [Parcubacteria group bacterium GW2011_GWB1_57_6]HCR52683.1 hypothetical protein [Candidatus Kaiserbacteria bacterium]